MSKNVSKCNVVEKYRLPNEIVYQVKAMLEAGKTYKEIIAQLKVGSHTIAKIAVDEELMEPGQGALSIEFYRKALTQTSAAATHRMIKHAESVDITELSADKAAKAAKDLHSIYRLETNQTTSNVSNLSSIMKTAEQRGKGLLDDSIDAVFVDITPDDDDM